MGRFTNPRDLYFGEGARHEVKNLHGERAMIVTGGGSMRRGGFLQDVEADLKEAGFEVEIFEGVESDPSVETVMKGAKAMEAFQPDWIIGIGGGSPIDAAKAMWLFYEYPEETFEQAVVPFSFPELRTKAHFCAIASTSGTATEVTAFSVITDYEKGIKYPLADFNITPDVAIVDPELTYTMPAKLCAHTGMDALTHAIEAALSKNANPLTDKDAYWAMQAIVQNLPRAVANGQDEAARTMMAYAENVAGMAFSNAGLGMVHAMAHALGGHYNLPHGVCNAVLLPYVLAFNSRSPVCRERFMTIAAAMGLQGTFTPDTAAPAVIQFVRQLSAGVGIPANLAQLNKVDPADFAALAELALHDTCMSTNQITPTRDEVVAVYTAAFRG